MKGKNKLAFFRSMKFGMILLVVILVFCLAGSIIAQGCSAEDYTRQFGGSGAKLILTLGLDRMFSTPLFILTVILLCLNLADCSIGRWKSTKAAGKAFSERCKSVPLSTQADDEALEKLHALLQRKHFKRSESQGRVFYLRDRFGLWGSFLTHVSLLLLVFVGAATLYGAKVQDVPVMVGETKALEDGTEITVESFRMKDENGKTDYSSVISVTLPGGKQSGRKEIRVNAPLRIGKYKIYQQNYYFGGTAEIINEETGESSLALLDESGFYTLDGETGYYLDGMYFGYEKDELGGVRFAENADAAAGENPIYVGSKVTSEGMMTCILFPGEEVSCGGLTFRAGDAVSFPGLRVKEISSALLGALYFVFVLFIFALWVCFFRNPICVALGKEGYAVISPRPPAGLLLELEAEGIAEPVTHVENKGC